MTAVLHTQGLEAGYQSIQVLWGVDLDVGESETVVLLGPNGAGKTTLLKCLHGLLRRGRAPSLFRGQDITRFSPRARVRLGLSHMSELGVFPDLTIAENLDLGALFVDRRTARRRIADLFALFPDSGRAAAPGGGRG